MKTQITAIMVFFFCFLPSTLLVGKTEDKKSPTLSVVEIRKKIAAIKKSNIKHVNPRQKDGVKSKKSWRKKNHKLTPTAVRVKKVKTKKVNRKNKKNSVIAKIKEATKIQKKVKRVTMTSGPVKKLKKKIFSPKLSVINSKTDFSFNGSDYAAMINWAEKNGKKQQLDKVVKNYGSTIKTLAAEFSVDYRIIIAICVHESGGDPNAISSTGDRGLMQMSPITAPSYGLNANNIFDPYQNLRAGIHYFSDMVKLFGNAKDAIYAYGVGQGNARKRIDKGTQSDEYRPVQRVLYLAQIQ